MTIEFQNEIKTPDQTFIKVISSDVGTINRKELLVFEIHHLPVARVLLERRVGAYGPENVEHVKNLKSWATAQGLLKGDRSVLGVTRDDPATTPASQCRYDACLVLEQDAQVPETALDEGTEFGGNYAIFTVPHTANDIGLAWRTMFGELTGPNWEVDDSRPIVERYSPRMLAMHLCEICVPVRSRAENLPAH